MTSHNAKQPKRILVTLATGKQGGGVVHALAKRNQAAADAGQALPFDVRAVTRSATSGKAKSLAALSGVSLLESQYEPETLFAKATQDGGKVYGVFSVQSFMLLKGGVEEEERQGKAMANAAATYGVRHFVYTSVDQGGLLKTDIPHFECKRLIEEHIQQLENKTLPYTILRPVAFMDNLSSGNDTMGKIGNTFFSFALHKPVQLIACSDIGQIAALAFERPDEYIGKTLSLAGDVQSPERIQETYKEVKGVGLSTTFSVVPPILLLFTKEMRTMFRFFNTHGYTADIEALRTVHPELKTFRRYVETEM